jgi:hypothetical protein
LKEDNDMDDDEGEARIFLDFGRGGGRGTED